MYRYREVIARLRLGDTDRQIAKANLLGRLKTALLRRVAKAQGWLVSSSSLPDEPRLNKHFEAVPLGISARLALLALARADSSLGCPKRARNNDSRCAGS